MNRIKAKIIEKLVLIILILALLSTFIHADLWTPSQPSHQTLYSDTITSKTNASPVSIADTQGLFVTGDITTLGRVGIGTTTPGQKLTVSGGNIHIVSENGQELIRLREVSDAYGLNIGLDGATGDTTFDRVVNNVASEAMRIQRSSGNVGIGTTTPLSKLEIANGGLRFSGTGAFGSGNDAGIFGDGGASGFLSFVTAGSQQVRITNSGNVGIGTTTPGVRLDVKAPGTNTAIMETVAQFHKTTAAGGALAISVSDSVATLLSSWITSGLNMDLAFTPTKSDGTQNEAMRIQATTGNVGIGTTSPTGLLTLRGPSSGLTDFNIFDNSGSVAGFRIRYDDAVGDTYLDNLYDSAASDIHFRTKAAGTPVDALFIESAGNVGIGTTSPGYKLDVAGDAHATSFPTSSDIRLKKNISQITNALDKLQNIHGVKFEWNDKYKQLGRATNGTQIGLIAQDVEKEFPELVTTWGNESYRAVDYGRFSAVLLEAIKEQQSEIEELKRENEQLRIDINNTKLILMSR